MIESIKESSVCGIISGLVSNGIVHPIDSFKAQSQYLFKTKFITRQMIPTLFEGYSLVLISTIPTTAIYFTALEFFKRQKLNILPEGPVKDFFVGVLTQAVASIFFTPRDVIKERLQVQHLRSSVEDRKNYDGAIDCFKKIYNSEGLKGIYKGYYQTLVLWGIYGGLFLALHGEMQQFLKRNLNHNLSLKEVPSYIVSISAILSASIAALVTNPLDVIKLHYQVRIHKTNSWKIFQEINALHGYGAWTKGAMERVMWVAPRTAIAFGVYDYAKRILFTNVT